MKTVLFDLDGTISDSKEGITKCAQYALQHFGIEEPDPDKLEFFIGPPLRYTFQKYYGMDEKMAEAATQKYRERYHTTGIYECRMYEGVPELLHSLKEKGYRIGLASSKPEESCRIILEHFGIAEYFDEVVGATMDGRIDSKKEVLQEALRRLEIADVSEVVLVGDTHFDVEGATEVGMSCIGITYGFGTREELENSGAAEVLDSTLKLKQYFEK